MHVPGLDPGIDPRIDLRLNKILAKEMDRRVKPGDDNLAPMRHSRGPASGFND